MSLAAIFLIGYGALLTYTLFKRLIALPAAYKVAKAYADQYEEMTGQELPGDSLISPALVGNILFSIAVNVLYWLSVLSVL